MDLDQNRKNLPIYSIRNKLITEIQRSPTIILLGKFKFIFKKKQLLIQFFKLFKGETGCGMLLEVFNS